jgi:hypothetical protein
LENFPLFRVVLTRNARSHEIFKLNSLTILSASYSYTEPRLALRRASAAETLATSGPTASNPLNVCGVLVATCIGNPRKDEYKIYSELLQLHPSGRRETSGAMIYITSFIKDWSRHSNIHRGD